MQTAAEARIANGPSWFSWISFPHFAPLSGAVTQDFSTWAYRGVPEIESEVVQKAASFGRQLGILSNAVIDIADHLAKKDPYFAAKATAEGRASDETPVGKLRVVVAEVEKIKDENKLAAKRDAEDALKGLENLDPNAFAQLRASLREPPGK